MISKDYLQKEYLSKKKSTASIANFLQCSENKVNYWLKKHSIPKRTISEAIYIKKNPNGDPFSFHSPNSPEENFLFGLGLGLYWGEGTKANRYAIRLGNSDVNLLNKFILFLETFYKIQRKNLRFGLHIFGEAEGREALKYWCRGLRVSPDQFYKPTIKKSQSNGNYREKAKHGVVTVYFSNKKARDHLMNQLENLFIK